MIAAVTTVRDRVYGDYKIEMHLITPQRETFKLTCNLRNGFTMAQYRSTDSAVNVKTETPMEISLADSVMRHSQLPHGHDSNVYTNDASGTQMMMTNRSASASENMYLERWRQKILDEYGN